MFLNKLSKLFQSDFVKNVATLATGTTIAQAIPIAISPILTRLYTPEDFGILALFMAMTAILGAIANGKYELAIMLPKKKEEVLNILVLSTILAVSFSMILLLVVILFKKKIAALIGEPQIENWLFFVPISVLFIGLFNALNLYNIKQRNYRNISFSNVTKSSGMGLTQVGLGFMQTGALGLVLGQVVSYLSGNFMLSRELRKSNHLKELFNFRLVKKLATRYSKFPLFTMPSTLLNSISLNLVNFLITGLFSTTVLGYYSLARRMIGIPSMVIGNSIGQVYFEKMTSTKNNGGNVIFVFRNVFQRLLLLSVPLFLVAFLVVEPVFAFVFGEEWRIAGYYAKILIPLAAVRFVSSSLANTMNVFERQNIGLIINVILLSTLMVITFLSKIYGYSILKFLILISVITSIEYLFFIFIYWRIVLKWHLEKC